MAEVRADLRVKLAVDAGGVVFITIQKFFPEDRSDRHPLLSGRRNIVVIADETHRSQYDFIGFTGTPIELWDANTRRVRWLPPGCDGGQGDAHLHEPAHPQGVKKTPTCTVAPAPCEGLKCSGQMNAWLNL